VSLASSSLFPSLYSPSVARPQLTHLRLHRGTTLTIEAVATFLEDVEEGAYVVLQVKYGLIKLVNTEADLCDQVSNVDLACPIKKGQRTIKKEVSLPKEIPPVSLPFASPYCYEGVCLL
jgi:ML domain